MDQLHYLTLIFPGENIDGYARILSPIFNALNNNVYEYGKFYKDYIHSTW
jgi:hypothetical protein